MFKEIFFAVMVVIAVKGCIIISHEYPYTELKFDLGDGEYEAY